MTSCTKREMTADNTQNPEDQMNDKGLNFSALVFRKKNKPYKGPVKLIKRVKIAHSLPSVSNQFHVIILSWPMQLQMDVK